MCPLVMGFVAAHGPSQPSTRWMTLPRRSIWRSKDLTCWILHQLEHLRPPMSMRCAADATSPPPPPPCRSQAVGRFFLVKERNTSLTQELRGGLVTFLTVRCSSSLGLRAAATAPARRVLQLEAPAGRANVGRAAQQPSAAAAPASHAPACMPACLPVPPMHSRRSPTSWRSTPPSSPTPAVRAPSQNGATRPGPPALWAAHTDKCDPSR